MVRRKWFAAGLAACVWSLAMATGNDAQQPGQGELRRMVGHLAKPERRDFSEDLLGLLWAPDGFEINVFARGLGNPRMLAVGRDGAVYVTRREQNDVIVLIDRDDDGCSDSTRTVLPNLKGAHGIAINNDQLYICTDTKLYRAELRSDGSAGTPKLLIEHLPDGGQHPNRTLGFGPDGMLYISVGSSCNACDESKEEHAAMLRARPDGSQRAIAEESRIFAFYGIKVVFIETPERMDPRRFFLLAARNRGVNVEAFTDSQAAEEWLLN